MRDKRRKKLLKTTAQVRLATLLLATLALPSLAADKKEDKWYQVEVIIFQQEDRYQEEQPRRDIKLQYPANYMELVDPTLTVPEDDLNNENTHVVATTPNMDFEKERPFEILDKSQRAMNQYATTLKRRSGYQLLFHEAWRQPGIGPDSAPWLLVRAGKLHGAHFELEGSMRLILSNYLHMETNLWLTKFTENFGQENDLWPLMPDYPIRPTEEDGTDTLENGPLHANTLETGVLDSTLENTFDNTLDRTLEPTLGSNFDNTLNSNNDFSGTFPDGEGLLFTKNDDPYLISSIDLFKINRKLKPDNEVYYLDHPRMGVLVRVSRYKLPEPKPLPKPEPITEPKAPLK